MKHAKRTAGSIFVRLTTVNGTSVSILPTMISFVAAHCGTTKVFLEARQEPLEVKATAGEVRTAIRNAYRNLILLGLLRNFPFPPFFGGNPFGTNFSFAADFEIDGEDDCTCEADEEVSVAAAIAANSSI